MILKNPFKTITVQRDNFIHPAPVLARSEWFGPDTAPYYVGVYEVQFAAPTLYTGYAYWNGASWAAVCLSAANAVNSSYEPNIRQDRTWRGLVGQQP